MKIFSDDALAALQRGDAIVGGAVEILCDPPVRLFSGYGTVAIDGETYQGIGATGLAQVTGGILGGTAQNVDLTLSGIDPEVLELVEADDVERAPVTIYRLIWSSDGKTLLGGYVYARGSADQLSSEEVIGGAATLTCSVENAANGLGRRGGRVRSDADQRLIKADDGFLKNVAFAAQKTLYWGGKRPSRAGAVLNGGNTGGPGVGSLDGSGSSVSSVTPGRFTETTGMMWQ